MKQGRSLIELAQELERREQAKRDFIADTRLVNFWEQPLPESSPIQLHLEGQGDFPLNRHCQRQVSRFLDIPAKYYDRMVAQAPALAVETLNTWLERSPSRRLVRTLDGTARAWLSDRYHRIDNYALANAVLPLVTELSPDAWVESCQVTETKMYLKVINPRLTDEVKPGDYVQSGFILSNSEVGAGSVQVQPLIYRLVCSNGLVVNEAGLTRYHLGSRTGRNNEAFELYSERTLALEDQALLGKVQDTVRAAAQPEQFAKVLQRMRQAAATRLEGNPAEVVEVTGKKVGLLEAEQGDVLTHLIQGGDLSQWGLVNAITRTSQDIADYERATELERLGGVVLAMGRST